MLYLAIDGGGTKTEGILADKTRAILSHRVTGPSNPQDVTLPEAVRTLTDLVRALLRDADAGGKNDVEISLFAGVAGVLSCRDRMLEALTAALRNLVDEPDFSRVHISRIGLDSDITILFAAEIPDRDGACVISGTGSVCFLRQGNTLSRIGGWGYLLDSGGDGYSIGRDALTAALRAHDGRGEATLLTERLHAHLGKSVPEALNDIYIGGKAFIAAAAPVVFEAADNGDVVARRILARNAAELAELIQTACRQAVPTHAPLPVILGGGLSQHRPDWVRLVREALPSDISADLIVASKPPVMGALTRSMQPS